MNTEVRTKAKNYFEKDLFKLMNSSVYRKSMGNVRKHRDIKLLTTDRRMSRLVLQPIVQKMVIIKSTDNRNE